MVYGGTTGRILRLLLMFTNVNRYMAGREDG